jgi:outer membrane protein
MRTPLILALLAAPAAAQTPAPPSTAAPASEAPALPANVRVLSLDDAVRTALTQHPNLKQAAAQDEAARAVADQSRAGLLPQVNGRASVQKSGQNQTGGFNPVIGTRTGTFYSAGVTVDQLIWDFGRTTDRWGAAKASARAQERSGEATVNQVVQGVRAAFFTARAQKALLQVAQETLANQQRHLEQVEAFITIGTRPEIDRAQARTDVANAQVALIRAQNDYATGRAQLNLAMGVEGSTDYDVADDALPPVAGEDAALDTLATEAEQQRPEIAALKAQREAQVRTTESRRGDYWPDIGAQFGATETGPSTSDLQGGWTGTLTLNWPFFSGFGTEASVRESKARTTALDAQIEGLRQQVRVAVEQAQLAVRGARAEIDAADEALANARERLRLAEGRYQTGVGSIIELEDAQLAVSNAAAQRVQSEYDLAAARAQLLFVLGRDRGSPEQARK